MHILPQGMQATRERDPVDLRQRVFENRDLKRVQCGGGESLPRMMRGGHMVAKPGESTRENIELVGVIFDDQK